VTNIAAALRAEPDNFDGTATRRLIEARSVQAMQAKTPSTNQETKYVPENRSSFGASSTESPGFPGLSAAYPAPVVVWDNALGDRSSSDDNDNSNSELVVHGGDGGSIMSTIHGTDGVLLSHLARSAETVFELLTAAAASASAAEVTPSGSAESAPQSSVWYAAGSPPKCGVEALLPELRKLVPGLKGHGDSSSSSRSSGSSRHANGDEDAGEEEEGEEWLGCEYWVRVQPAGRGVAAHYDFDVARKRLPSNHPQHGLVAPHRSSIFYLSGATPPSSGAPPAPGGSDSGFGAGPTVVLEQRRAPGSSASSDGEVSDCFLRNFVRFLLLLLVFFCYRLYFSYTLIGLSVSPSASLHLACTSPCIGGSQPNPPRGCALRVAEARPLGRL